MKTIKSKKDFEKVFSTGRRANGRLVRIVLSGCDEGNPGRVAFVAAKRLGNAVCRNRSKRVLREAAGLCELPLADTDVILFATNKTAGSHPSEVAADLSRLLRKATS